MDGKIVAVRKDEYENLELITKDIARGTISILDQWENQESEYYDVMVGIGSGKNVIIYEDKNALFWKNERLLDETSERTSWKYNIESGEKTRLPLGEGIEAEQYGIWGMSDKHYLIRYMPLDEVLSDSEPDMDFQTYYEKYGGHYLDWESGEKTEIATIADLDGISLYDNKVFFDVPTEVRGEYNYYYADLDDADRLVEYKVKKKNGHQGFTIYNEGSSFFLDPNRRSVKKEDYYNGNY